MDASITQLHYEDLSHVSSTPNTSRRRCPRQEEAEAEDDENVLRELSTELILSSRIAEQNAQGLGAAAGTGLEELDFEDLSWCPDPVDAGPDFRKTQGTDIISHLLTLHSQEAFIREFQVQLGKRLLSSPPTSLFNKETQTLELLKLRFGETPLQNCMVMLRDILDSRRIDLHIRDTQHLEVHKPQLYYSPTSPSSSIATERAPEVHAKILSKLFWPELVNENYNLPKEIDALLARFDEGFESLKKTRKLKWMRAVGNVVVELSFKDRELVIKNVPPWAATVVYTFANPPPGEDPFSQAEPPINGGTVGVKWSIQQLSRELEMSDKLLKKR